MNKEEKGGRIRGAVDSLSSAESYLQFLQFDMGANGLYSSIFVTRRGLLLEVWSRHRSNLIYRGRPRHTSRGHARITMPKASKIWCKA